MEGGKGEGDIQVPAFNVPRRSIGDNSNSYSSITGCPAKQNREVICWL